ncbi:MAG: hypothetical protein GX886_16400 [Comamonadaceae bacterium]|nr:hypothetical protein [Comamonadaceae bacterium]
MIGVLTSFSVGLDFSIADMLGWIGLREHAAAMGDFMTVKLSTYSAAIPVLLMLIVLLIRPAGLMGERN